MLVQSILKSCALGFVTTRYCLYLLAALGGNVEIPSSILAHCACFSLFFSHYKHSYLWCRRVARPVTVATVRIRSGRPISHYKHSYLRCRRVGWPSHCRHCPYTFRATPNTYIVWCVKSPCCPLYVLSGGCTEAGLNINHFNIFSLLPKESKIGKGTWCKESHYLSYDIPSVLNNNAI